MEKVVWGPPTEGLALSISVEKPKYPISDPITLNLAFKNLSDSPTLLAVRSAWADYGIRVRLEGAGEVQKTEYALRAIEASGVGRRMTTQLQPAQIQTDSLELSKGFDMSRAGVYAVSATRETFKKGNTSEFATVTSNILVILIVP